eukprot:5084749-Prymnesium_polylepis.1
MQTVHALREIRIGEEVCVAYIGGDADGTRATRQSQLEEKFGFSCCCPQCHLSGAALEQSEARQRRINEIIARLRTRPVDVVAIVQERFALMALERMPEVWGKASVLLALDALLARSTGTGSGADSRRKLAWKLTRDAQQC